jgi:hypothetical protein
LDEAQAEEARLKQTVIPETALDAEVNRHPEVVQLAQVVQAYQRQIDNALKAARQGKDEPLVQELRKKVSEARAALEARKTDLRPTIRQALREQTAADLRARISRLQRKINFLAANKTALAKEQNERRQEIQKRMQNGADLDDVREDLGQIENLVKQIAAEELALKLELDAPKREQVLEQAVIYHARAPAGRMTTAALVGLACALLVFVGLALRLRVSLR